MNRWRAGARDFLGVALRDGATSVADASAIRENTHTLTHANVVNLGPGCAGARDSLGVAVRDGLRLPHRRGPGRPRPSARGDARGC